MNAAVLVINWNSGPHLRRLLQSLAGLLPELVETLIIDNGSVDESCRNLPSGHSLRVLPLEQNQGFAAAANQGISGLDADWIFLLNPDLISDPTSLTCLYAHAQAAPEDCAILCGPLLSVEDHRWQAEFQIRQLPALWSVLKDAIFLDEIFSLFRSADAFPQPLSAARDVEQPAAAYWLLRKRAWEQIGGFDEAFYPAWFEDVDFCRRLKDAGWKNRFFPDCPALHVGGVSLGPLGRPDFTRIYYQNLIRYLRKHHAGSLPLLWLPIKLGSWIRQRLAS